MGISWDPSFILKKKTSLIIPQEFNCPETAQQIHWKEQMIYSACKHILCHGWECCPSMAQLDSCKEIPRKNREILLGSPAALSPSLLPLCTYYHFLTLKPPRGIGREAWPINQQMKGPFALFLHNTFFSCTVLNVRFIKFPPKKKSNSAEEPQSLGVPKWVNICCCLNLIEMIHYKIYRSA